MGSAVLHARGWPFVLLLAFVAASLTGLSPYHLNQITLVAAYCIALIGLNVVVGLAGQISLAHGAFFAIGAYGTAVLVVECGLSFPLALLGAGLVSSAVGFVTGLPALRLRGHYLAIATLALSVAAPAIANRWTGLTGGSSGLEMGTIPVPAWLPIGHDAYLFVWAIGLAALAIWAYNRVAASPLGIALLAVRETKSRPSRWEQISLRSRCPPSPSAPCLQECQAASSRKASDLSCRKILVSFCR